MESLWDDSAIIKVGFHRSTHCSRLKRCVRDEFQAFERAVATHRTKTSAEPDDGDDGLADVEAPFASWQGSTDNSVYHDIDSDAPQLPSTQAAPGAFSASQASALPSAALLWPPPPLPGTPGLPSNEALNDLLMAWYWSGFYAGRYSAQAVPH